MTGGENGEGTIYSYSLGYAPNSDVLSANDSVNGNWTFAYDDFNRLSSSSGPQSYTYDYDRYGNRWHQNVNGGGALFVFDNYNHITGDGVIYDAAGNMTKDPSGQTYTYDAENRLIQVNGVSGQCSTASACYGYDAKARRASKTTGTTTVNYLYDLAGRAVAEVSSAGAWNRGEVFGAGNHLATYTGGISGATYFDATDWLGTERVRSGLTGTVESCTSLPFGDGQVCTGSETSPVHFTGKERDSESGLDYFIHRHYANTMGRFMQPDPDGISSSRRNPQSWNMYAYVLNNPLRFTDPDGMNYTVCDTQGKNCADLTDKQYDQWRKDNPNVQVSASGAISIVNDNGSTTKVGQESYYNEKDIQAAQQLVATQGLILNLGVRMYAGGITGGAFGWAAGEFIGGLAEGLSAETTVGETAVAGEASTPIGSTRSPMNVAPGTNEGTTIGGRWYTGHALDQMQGRGLMPSVIEDTIKTGTASPGNTAGTTVYMTGQARVVVNSAGDVVTAMPK